MKIYLLSDAAKLLTWHQWKKMGGCGLSNSTECAVSRTLGILDNQTLGEIQSACVVAGREIARFAVEHLNRPDFAVVEYNLTHSENSNRNQARRERNQAMKDLGLVRVRGALGGTYWE